MKSGPIFRLSPAFFEFISAISPENPAFHSIISASCRNTSDAPAPRAAAAMAPPTFADLGKQARDLFSKGYNHGVLKVETTTRGNESGTVEFKTNATHSLANQQLGGNVDIKYKIPSHGVVVTEKWATEGSLGTTLEISDQFSRGFKVTLDSLYVPNTGKRDAQVKGEWTNENVKLNANLTLIGGPLLNLAGVFGHNGFLFGVNAKVDVAANELKNTSVAFGYQDPFYTVHSYTNDGKEFGGSLYHRVHKNVEIGAQLGWINGADNTNYALGSIYRVSPDLVLRAKVDNKSNVGLAATHSLGPNVKATVSTLFALSAVNSNNKLGFGLEYAP
ncbi:Voltage-dependent anion-selective channel protein 3 [Aphelenchoides fujianensis]|nr:Voltage-dependent anion-selective channel protein 3 [Aphelenchoides fujianensis]